MSGNRSATLFTICGGKVLITVSNEQKEEKGKKDWGRRGIEHRISGKDGKRTHSGRLCLQLAEKGNS